MKGKRIPDDVGLREACPPPDDQYDAWAQGWGTTEHVAPPRDGVAPNPETDDCCLDPGIYEIVWGLHEAGVETLWSCQGGGPPHAYMHRFVAFGLNDRLRTDIGHDVLEIARSLGMPVAYLVQVESVLGTENPPTFWWELHFDRFTNWKRPDSRAALAAHEEGR